MMLAINRLLVLAPHTDDAELGCGGLIARMLEENVDVHVVAFSAAEDSLPNNIPTDTLRKEFHTSMTILGIKQENASVLHYKVRRFPEYRQDILEYLVNMNKKIQPDLVCLPCSQDVHQDHQIIHSEGVRAFKDRSVLGYELPWNQTDFSAPFFVILNKKHIEQKWAALQAYESQIKLNRPYFQDEFIKGLARIRGTQIKKTWAEAYEVLRVVT